MNERDNNFKRGRGIDALCASDPRLKAKWMWTQGRGAMMPYTSRRCVGQNSEAYIGDKDGIIITLTVMKWTNGYDENNNSIYGYEPNLEWRCEVITFDNGQGEEEDKHQPTRLLAQLAAEKLGRQLIGDLDTVLKTVGL